MLQRPAYVPEWISTAPMTFRFNNEISLALDNPGNIPEWLGDPLWRVNYKGKAALGLACIEWVTWRLAGLTDVTDVLSRLEAAWASMVALPYSKNLDYDGVSNDVMSGRNPDGPRQDALIRVQDLHFAFKKGRQQMSSEAGKSAALALHMLPPDAGFEPWLRRALDALATNCPAGEVDHQRKVKVVDHGAQPPVPREWFEALSTPVDAAADRAAWDRFLRGLSPSANPYLVPEDTLLAEGFTGPLYRMD
ncbi:hypothetical protein MFUL124B02_13455 [Myxococcus fulvus 124B02]|nr:hypothetical protein MFUL124B02_13455 [Myxococcus fulvus 124B02]